MDNKEEMKTAPQAENAIDRNDEIIFDELLSQVDPDKVDKSTGHYFKIK
ncbi:hypothetical protein ACT4WO_19690 (plasmid) [Acinetobacter baumannii]